MKPFQLWSCVDLLVVYCHNDRCHHLHLCREMKRRRSLTCRGVLPKARHYLQRQEVPWGRGRIRNLSILIYMKRVLRSASWRTTRHAWLKPMWNAAIIFLSHASAWWWHILCIFVYMIGRSAWHCSRCTWYITPIVTYIMLHSSPGSDKAACERQSLSITASSTYVGIRCSLHYSKTKWRYLSRVLVANLCPSTLI